MNLENLFLRAAAEFLKRRWAVKKLTNKLFEIFRLSGKVPELSNSSTCL
jgi:hypothetical protein